MLNWIKLEPGCKMPDYDIPVLWRTEDGRYFVSDIDKDDPDFWNAKPATNELPGHIGCTHFAFIPDPENI